MAGSSLSLLSSSSAFTSDSPSSSSRFYYHKDFRPNPRFTRPISPGFKLKVTSRLADGSPDQFLQNNSIADFMRFKSGTAGELQTAVVSYRKRFPGSILQPYLQVDLVSTIHIADKEYFATLQKELETYDCVLYEMVASRESLESRKDPSAAARLKSTKSRGFSIIGFIQRQMARFLSLDFQLDCLDYQTQNWYHADLDFETFELLQREKGESFFTFARDMTLRSTKALIQSTSIPEELGPWRSKLLWASRVLPMPLVGLVLIGTVCDVGSQPSDFPEIEALSRLDFGGAMKLFLAKRLTSDFTSVTAEVEEDSVIIGERNRAATEALRKAINNGDSKIAILYGGGHMPDLGRRLREEFDLVPSNVRWITAWTIIRNQNITSSSSPFLKTVAEVLGWPLNRYQTLALLLFSSVLAVLVVDLWFWELFFGTTVNWVLRWVRMLFRFLIVQS